MWVPPFAGQPVLFMVYGDDSQSFRKKQMAPAALPAVRKHHFPPPHLFYFVRSRLHTAGITKLGLFWSPDECLSSRQYLFCSNHTPSHTVLRGRVFWKLTATLFSVHPEVSIPPEVTVAVRNYKATGAHLPGASSLLLHCFMIILGMTGIQTSHFSWYQRKLWYRGYKATNRRCHSREGSGNVGFSTFNPEKTIAHPFTIHVLRFCL